VTGVADRVLGEVLADDPDHPRAERHRGLALDAKRHTCTGSGVGQPFDDMIEDRSRLRRGQRDHLAAALELGEEEDLVDQLAGALDLGTCLVDQSVHVGIGERRVVEQGEDPGQRRAQLMRHRRSETRAKLVKCPFVVHHTVTISKPGQHRPPVYRRGRGSSPDCRGRQRNRRWDGAPSRRRGFRPGCRRPR